MGSTVVSAGGQYSSDYVWLSMGTGLSLDPNVLSDLGVLSAFKKTVGRTFYISLDFINEAVEA